jgi:hypothetical protein
LAGTRAPSARAADSFKNSDDRGFALLHNPIGFLSFLLGCRRGRGRGWGSRVELQLKQGLVQAGDFFVKLVCEQGAARCSLPFSWCTISFLFRKNALLKWPDVAVLKGEQGIIKNMKLRHDGGVSLFAQTTDGVA